MGFYNYNVFQDEAVKAFLESSPNYNMNEKQAEKKKAVIFEDAVFMMSTSIILGSEMIVEDTDTLYYSSTVPRRLYTYPIPGIIKIKANWEDKVEFCVDL